MPLLPCPGQPVDALGDHVDGRRGRPSLLRLFPLVLLASLIGLSPLGLCPLAYASPPEAVLLSPAPGTVLAGATVTFTWTAGSGVLEYWLDVGTTPAGSDLLHQSQGTNLSGTVSGLPTAGQTVYVRLWSRFTGVWQQFNDYTYTACSSGCRGGGGSAEAVLQTPVPGTMLSGSTVTFTWSAGSEAMEYWLDVGTTPGGSDLLHQSQGTSLSGTVFGLPTTGQAVYVRLWSLIAGAWHFIDYTYTACSSECGGGGGSAKAVLQTPAPGTVLAGSTVTFTWSAGSGVSQYWLDIGTTPGGTDLYGQSQGTNLSGTVAGLPTTGQPVYVRLWSLIAGAWQFNDYIYTAFGATCTPASTAVLQTPAPGSTLAGATVTFTWSRGCQVAEYWLDIGTAPGGSDLLHQSQGTNLSGTVGGLPTTGQTVYVRLWSRFTGVWQQFNDYAYTACSSRCGAVLQTPAPGTVLAGATVTFMWSAGSGVLEYWLDIGTAPGGSDLLHQSQGTSLSGTVFGLPTIGQAVYVRLWSRFTEVWQQFNDYAYTVSSSGCDSCGFWDY